jgi:hypothetical protein
MSFVSGQPTVTVNPPSFKIGPRTSVEDLALWMEQRTRELQALINQERTERIADMKSEAEERTKSHIDLQAADSDLRRELRQYAVGQLNVGLVGVVLICLGIVLLAAAALL